PQARLTLADLRALLLSEIATARRDGSHKTVVDCVSELRQIELAQLRLIPEGSDRSVVLKEFSDTEIRSEFERRNLQGTIRVIWVDAATAPKPMAGKKEASHG
ncbi:MAG: hypothetical protein ACRD1Y_05900, partial [Terriglobales bacterium]